MKTPQEWKSAILETCRQQLETTIPGKRITNQGESHTGDSSDRLRGSMHDLDLVFDQIAANVAQYIVSELDA